MWRPEIARELALHQPLPLGALYLQVVGVSYDLQSPDIFIRASWHGADHPVSFMLPDPRCALCAQLERRRRWLYLRCLEAMQYLPPELQEYQPLRQILGAGPDIGPQRPLVLMQRFGTDEREALVVLLWLVRQVLMLSHAPGALTALWRESFLSDRARAERAAALGHAFAAHRAARDV